MQKTLLKKMGKKMKKTPRVSAETRGVRESGDDGAHRPTAARCVFRAVGSARAQRRGRCRVGAVRCGCVFQQRRRQGGGQPRSEGAMRRESRRRSRRGVCFSAGGGAAHGGGGAGGRGARRGGQRGWDGGAGISRSPSRFRESPRRDRVQGRRCRGLRWGGSGARRLRSRWGRPEGERWWGA